jgi:hypothetical protein
MSCTRGIDSSQNMNDTELTDVRSFPLYSFHDHTTEMKIQMLMMIVIKKGKTILLHKARPIHLK